MARLTPQQWEVVRADYETTNLSLSELSKKHNVHKSNISKRAKKEDWNKGKAQHIVMKKKNAIKALHETQQETQRLNATTQQAIDSEVNKQLEAEGLFVSSALFNQQLANRIIEDQTDEDGNPLGLEISQLDVHSRLTNRNKETVLGKNPDTAIQINNEQPKQIKRVIVDAKDD